jgi:hypothetical protein
LVIESEVAIISQYANLMVDIVRRNMSILDYNASVDVMCRLHAAVDRPAA